MRPHRPVKDIVEAGWLAQACEPDYCESRVSCNRPPWIWMWSERLGIWAYLTWRYQSTNVLVNRGWRTHHGRMRTSIGLPGLELNSTQESNCRVDTTSYSWRYSKLFQLLRCLVLSVSAITDSFDYRLFPDFFPRFAFF